MTKHEFFMPVADYVPPTVTYRWYQDECVEAFFEFFRNLPPNTEGNPIGALPTGTGKSLVIAKLIDRAVTEYKGTRILCLTHVSTLIKQNSEKLQLASPSTDFGIFSSQLKRKDSSQDVIFGGVQSVVKKLELFGWRDLIVIDECHLLSPKETTSYAKIIDYLKRINPRLRVIGLSATPFRLGQGMLTEKVEQEDEKQRR